MKRSLFIFLFLWQITACDRYPDPSYEYLQRYTFSFLNTQQKKYFSDEYVDDSVYFRVFNVVDLEYDPLRVEFEVIKGGGTASASNEYTNSNGIISARWKLGAESFDQILRASVYDKSGKYLSSSNYIVYGFRTNAWDAVADHPDGNMTGLIADTVNKFTMMVNNSRVYRQGERYYQWEEIDDPLLNSPRTIHMDSEGIIYVSTWQGEVIKSTDHGKTWEKCTKPFPDRPYFIYITLSNDNSVWVFDFDHPTRFSMDGGATWIDAGSELSSSGYGDVFRLRDGSLLYHGSNCCSLSRSFDNGHTWSHIETPGLSVKLYVNDMDEIFICTQANGITIFKSTDYGVTFNQVHNVYPDWGTSMDNTFNKWKGNYYILIPGYGILKSADLIHFEDYWKNTNLLNLFIDHNGVLIAKDWDWKTVYYLKNK